MGKIYLGSDWHFSRKKKNGEMRFKYTEGKDILNKYRKVITNKDLFIFLGDFSYIGPENVDGINELISEFTMLPGGKILIRGNNDECKKTLYKKIGFKKVFNSFRMGNISFSHIPEYVDEQQINIHGHIHGEDTYWDVEPLNHTDCFTGKFNNYPVEITELLYNEKNIVDKSIIDIEVIGAIYRELY